MYYTIQQLKEQFKGHPAQNFLETRVTKVNLFFKKYPTFFNEIITNFTKDICDTELCQNIESGNIAYVLKLLALIENKLYSSEEYSAYVKKSSGIDSDMRAINTMKNTIKSNISKMMADWVSQGNDQGDFKLETFTWSGDALVGLSAKDIKKKNNLKVSTNNMEKNVIPKKIRTNNEKQAELKELEAIYKSSNEFLKLHKLNKFLTNKDWIDLVDLQKAINTKLCTNESGDGGFELSLTDDGVLEQWFPNRVEVIKRNLMNGDIKSEREVTEIINRLQIMQNVHYVASFRKFEGYEEKWEKLNKIAVTARAAVVEAEAVLDVCKRVIGVPVDEEEDECSFDDPEVMEQYNREKAEMKLEKAIVATKKAELEVRVSKDAVVVAMSALSVLEAQLADTNTDHAKKWVVPVEQDIIIFDPKTNVVHDCGEVKKNFNDIGHGDIQLRRDKCIILGSLISDQIIQDQFPQYFDKNTLVNTYIAKDKRSIKTPIFKTNDCLPLLDTNTGFIITMEQAQTRLAVPSDIEVQIANWIYSSDNVDETFIQANIDKLISGLGIKCTEDVVRDREVIIIR